MERKIADSRQYPDFGAWTEMLSRLSNRNAELAETVTKRWPRRSGAKLLAELERERARIARELHAGAGQPLAGIKLHLEALDGLASSMPETAHETIGRLQTLADQALSQVRAVSHRLHPPEWQEMKLQEALKSLAASSGLEGNLKMVCEFPPLGEEPAHDVKIQIYRCAQECISNIIRHSGATEAKISLLPDGDRLILTVEDNGRGFDTKQTAGAGGGVGLRAIQENARSTGGWAQITSGPNGTKIVVNLPLEGE